MSGLFDSLTSVTRSLTAARVGMDVTGQNIANVNTDGYSRRTVIYAEEPAGDPLGAGRGVTVQAIQAQRDQFVESRLWSEQRRAAFDDALVGGLSEVDAVVGLPGQSLDANLSAFFDAFSTLAQDPTSVPARDGVVLQGSTLAAAFHDIADRLGQAQTRANAAVGADVDEVNQLAAQVAALNAQIVQNGNDVETLRDTRNLAVARLSELAGVTVTPTVDGTLDLAVGNGRPLVVGGTAYALTAIQTPPSGHLGIETGGFTVTGEITGGEIGGLLTLRDTSIPSYLDRLDQLAYDVATAVNTLHTGGSDGNGDPGGAFFTAPAAVAGAASALTVSSAVLLDSRLVAASATGAPGNNDVARAIAGLRDGLVTNGGTATPVQAWGQIAYRVGADLAARQGSAASHAQVVRQLQQLRDQTSGVSLDEEAANLMRYQRAYEANARYFTTIVDTLDTLLNMVH
jgi:flagellar hook-associated protein 1 FlgK